MRSAGLYTKILALTVVLNHHGRAKASDSFPWRPYVPAPTRHLMLVRGGSSPYSARVPPKDQGRLGMQSQDQKREFYGLSKRTNEEGEEIVDDDAETREVLDAFLTRDSRNSFIARVYSILSVQLILTAISCFLFGLNPLLSSISQFARAGQAHPLAYVPLLGLLASTVAWFRVAFSVDARRKAPSKWWWLSIFTIGEAVSVGYLSSFYKFRSVVMAMGATAAATLAVSLYTIAQKNPNRDLSQLGASLSSWAVILMSYLFIGVLQKGGILPEGFLPFSDMLYSGLAACLFTAFLAYDTKLIVGGKHSKYRMNEKDYVYGSMALYMDIINMFLQLLRLIGEDRE